MTPRPISDIEFEIRKPMKIRPADEIVFQINNIRNDIVRELRECEEFDKSAKGCIQDAPVAVRDWRGRKNTEARRRADLSAERWQD